MNSDAFGGFVAAIALGAALLVGFAFGYDSGFWDGVVACKAQIDTRCQPATVQP